MELIDREAMYMDMDTVRWLPNEESGDPWWAYMQDHFIEAGFRTPIVTHIYHNTEDIIDPRIKDQITQCIFEELDDYS